MILSTKKWHISVGPFFFPMKSSNFSGRIEGNIRVEGRFPDLKISGRMKPRYAQMRSYYQKGIFKEENNGYVFMGNTAGLGLKEKRNLKSLVKAENGDRKRLYGEIGRALKIESSR